LNTRVLASQQSQREFVANVSHELKTPLTSVQGFAQALLDGTTDTPESRQQAARVIYDEAGRMHRMVLDLLELARLDAGTLDLQYAPVDICLLMDNVAAKFAPQAHSAGVSIQVEAHPLPPLMGDGDSLAQVFTNLVDNALKNTPSGGTITLRARQSGPEIQVEVADTGRGIPADALPHIFERFYQADPSRRGGENHGTGLGLAIVKEIVSAHGGKITVRSKTAHEVNETERSGSVFSVTLPLERPQGGSSSSRK
jgi:two-component system sensor histidine kinase ResE